MYSIKGYIEQDYKNRALTAAKELGYGENVVNQIKEAKTNDEIILIMGKARRKKFG